MGPVSQPRSGFHGVPKWNIDSSLMGNGEFQMHPKTDPSGRFVNNVYTAPPKPPSTVSSAISFVASGLGGAFQSLTGAGITDAEQESELPAETSTKDVAPAETSTEPTSSEARRLLMR